MRLTEVFGGRIWLVSKCGPEVQARTERWLTHCRFFEITGMDPSHVRFCRRRADKATHCAELGITHFVDDRREVLKSLIGIVPHLYLFGPQDNPAPNYATPTPTWDATEREILAAL